MCLTCQRSQKLDTSWYSACLCIVVPVGGPYAGGALSAFVRVSRQQKTYYHVLFVILCHVCIFLSTKQFSSSSFKFKLKGVSWLVHVPYQLITLGVILYSLPWYQNWRNENAQSIYKFGQHYVVFIYLSISGPSRLVCFTIRCQTTVYHLSSAKGYRLMNCSEADQHLAVRTYLSKSG